MVDNVKTTVKRVTSLPQVPEANTIYICKDLQDASKSYFCVTGIDGQVLPTIDTAAVHLIVADEVSRLPLPVTKTASLPNVGDVFNIQLDNLINIQYQKTSNSGYQTYSVNITSIGADRTIALRRDTVYDDASMEGLNSNSIQLTSSTPYQSDATTYGSMREWNRTIILDYATDVSWHIEMFGYGAGRLRFVIERHQATN